DEIEKIIERRVEGTASVQLFLPEQAALASPLVMRLGSIQPDDALRVSTPDSGDNAFLVNTANLSIREVPERYSNIGVTAGGLVRCRCKEGTFRVHQ
ncbi:MAG: hypothetical protein NTV14_07060, partial [Coprothermobacterota bacterium]|nr:hypothetical protein [Coprothermobacterota bacterium]